MRNPNKTMLFLIVGLVLAVVTTMTALSGQEQKSQRSSKEQEKIEHLGELPIVDFETPELSDPGKRAKRSAKSKTYDNPNERRIDQSDALTGVLRIDWELGLASALPVDQSIAIIIGEVIDAKAYLSEDRTNVYSEFTVRVNEILKNDSDEPITGGDLIITERQGGRVRLPSHIYSFRIAGQGTPKIGRRYVFFLGYNKYEATIRSLTSPRDMSRHILTGYELHAGKVFPLDGAGGRNFQDYKGRDEMAFLSEIRRSIAAS